MKKGTGYVCDHTYIIRIISIDVLVALIVLLLILGNVFQTIG